MYLYEVICNSVRLAKVSFSPVVKFLHFPELLLRYTKIQADQNFSSRNEAEASLLRGEGAGRWWTQIPTSLGLKIKCLRTEHTWNREHINTLRLYLPKATKLRWNFLKDVLWKNFICYYNCPCSTFKPTIQLIKIKIYVDTQKLSFPFLLFINNAL